MASHVINGLMLCRHPLSPRQILLLYMATLWTMATLEDGIMTTDDQWDLTNHAQYGFR